MAYANIALIGRARSGKDTVAARLVEKYGYQRIAFADPLKEMALELDPWITYELPTDGLNSVRLATLVEHVGWERAKDDYPEVRRILQHMGQGVRRYQQDFWLNVGLVSAEVARLAGRPVVFTDCRYENEAAALSAAGFQTVRITRPGTESPAPYGDHESETALDAYETDGLIVNDGSKDALNWLADVLPYL